MTFITNSNRWIMNKEFTVTNYLKCCFYLFVKGCCNVNMKRCQNLKNTLDHQWRISVSSLYLCTSNTNLTESHLQEKMEMDRPCCEYTQYNDFKNGFYWTSDGKINSGKPKENSGNRDNIKGLVVDSGQGQDSWRSLIEASWTNACEEGKLTMYTVVG